MLLDVGDLSCPVVIPLNVTKLGVVGVEDHVERLIRRVLGPDKTLGPRPRPAVALIGVGVVDEGHPHLAHLVRQLNVRLRLALKGVGRISETIDVVEDERNLLEMSGAVDGSEAVDVHVPAVRVDGDAGVRIRAGEKAPTAVLLIVSCDGRDTLPLRTERSASGSIRIRRWDTDGGVIGVQLLESGDLCGVDQQTASEPRLELLRGVDALFGVARALVKVVAEKERNGSEFTLGKKRRGLVADEVAVNDSADRRCGDAQRVGAVEDSVEGLPWERAHAGQTVASIRASSLGQECLEVRLPGISADELGDRATTLENGAAEQVVVLSIIGNELHTQ